VITDKENPIASAAPTDKDSFEKSLREPRRARAMGAIATLQRRSVERGLDRLSSDQISAEIAAVRELLGR